jgi:hypothetical protein
MRPDDVALCRSKVHSVIKEYNERNNQLKGESVTENEELQSEAESVSEIVENPRRWLLVLVSSRGLRIFKRILEAITWLRGLRIRKSSNNVDGIN